MLTIVQCLRGARQLPTEHIQLAMVIKKDGLKQATVKLSYLRGGGSGATG